MSLVQAKNVTVDFPVYGTNSRSVKISIANVATGGILGRDTHEKIFVRALDNVSLEFHEGDRVGLIGHNGSGKSTLLRVLAGIHEPVEGTVTVKGRVTSMLGITVGMDLEATGLENIFIRGRIMGVSSQKLRSMLDEIVEFSGIGDYLNLPMRTYSTGMIMRLAFAVATSVEADIILMDEWLSVGDSAFVNKARARLDRLVRCARIVVIASHDFGLIKSQCNQILKLEHGRLSHLLNEQLTLL